MLFNIDSMYEASQKLFDYLTKYSRYNAFLIDEVPTEMVQELGKAIQEKNRVKAVQLYLKIDARMDTIRDEHCYNNPSLPYKSSFRNIAKDAFRELKESWLIYNDDFKHIARILRFISTSDYYAIREFLIKRSHTMHNYWDIPLCGDDFYCGYIPLEAIMDYCMQIIRVQLKE